MTDAPQTPERAAPRSGRGARMRAAGFGLLAGLILGGVATALVYLDGRERLAALDARYVERGAEVEQATASLRQELVQARSLEALQRARIAAGRALEELDRANYGRSREQLHNTGLALADVDPAALRMDPAGLEGTRALVQSVLMEAAPDRAAQRSRIEEVVRALDGLLPQTLG